MELQLDSEQQQEKFGAVLSAAMIAVASDGLVVYLKGDLGAGKTTLVRGMLRGIGWSGPVKSPTYTIMEPYELNLINLYHFDLYRLADPEELDYLGLRELIGHGVLVFEWPEKGYGGLPAPDLLIEITHLKYGRCLKLHAVSNKGEKILHDQCVCDFS